MGELEKMKGYGCHTAAVYCFARSFGSQHRRFPWPFPAINFDRKPQNRAALFLASDAKPVGFAGQDAQDDHMFFVMFCP